MNVIVLDLETAHSAEDCQYCQRPKDDHDPLSGGLLCRLDATDTRGATFTPIGWNNRPALGLSVGCYWDYLDHRMHWFDSHTLEDTVRLLVQRQPLMVSFNGIAFDFVLMRGLLRRAAETQPQADALLLVGLCDAFKALCVTSYDLLAEIWRLDPTNKFARGMNSLDAIAQANGLGAKLSHGAQAPRDWAAGHWAQVLNHCSGDVYLTKALFEMVLSGHMLTRGSLREQDALLLPNPLMQGWQAPTPTVLP